MVQASAEVVTQARGIAAKLLEVTEVDIAFNDGLFVTPKSNRRLTMFDFAREIKERPALASAQPLHAKATFTGRIPAYPTGCAVCEVEIDPDTGAIEITRYASIDDAGQPINPMILHGQVHGGIAQGLGAALTEELVYDRGGQLLTGTLMDYAVPRADQLPLFKSEGVDFPSEKNPLGVKGVGEGSIIPPTAVIANAVEDALSDLGVEITEVPITSARLFSALQRAITAKR